MIFPDFRLSNLEKETADKKAAFESTRVRFVETAREKLHPITLIKENKKTVLAALFSLVAFGKLFGKLNKTLGPQLKGSMVFSVIKAAWFWKLIDLSFNLYKLSGPNTKRAAHL